MHKNIQKGWNNMAISWQNVDVGCLALAYLSDYSMNIYSITVFMEICAMSIGILTK